MALIALAVQATEAQTDWSVRGWVGLAGTALVLHWGIQLLERWHGRPALVFRNIVLLVDLAVLGLIIVAAARWLFGEG